MRTASMVIIKQLQNEGITVGGNLGLHWVGVQSRLAYNFLGCDAELPDAVQEALSHSIRITALLSKLRDSLDGNTEGST